METEIILKFSATDFNIFQNLSEASSESMIVKETFRWTIRGNCQVDSAYNQTNTYISWDSRKLFIFLRYEENFIEACIKLFLHVAFGSCRYKYVFETQLGDTNSRFLINNYLIFNMVNISDK